MADDLLHAIGELKANKEFRNVDLMLIKPNNMKQ